MRLSSAYFFQDNYQPLGHFRYYGYHQATSKVKITRTLVNQTNLVTPGTET